MSIRLARQLSSLCNAITLVALVVLVILASLTSGCALLGNKAALSAANKQVTEARAQIDKLKAQYDTDTKRLQGDFNSRVEVLLRQIDAQNQSASDSLYGADMTFSTLLSPSRAEIITNNFVNEAWAALGNKTPSREKMMEINARIKTELDETKTSLEQLRKTHDDAVAQSKQLAAKVDDGKAALDAAKKAMADAEVQYAKALAAKEGALNDKLATIAALERQRADDKAWVEAQKAKMMAVCGGISLLCIAGAIWLPLGRIKFIIGAVVFGLAAVAINFIQPWHIGVAVGVAVVALVAWLVYQHNRERIAATGVYSAIESFKTQSKDVYESSLKPHLAEWLTVYKRDANGNITKEPDKAAQDLIDKRLMEKDLK